MQRMNLDVIIVILVGLCLTSSGLKVPNDGDDDSCSDLKHDGSNRRHSNRSCTNNDDCLDTEKCCSFNSQMFCVPKISKSLTDGNEEKESKEEDEEEDDYHQCKIHCPWSVGQVFVLLVCVSGAVISFTFLAWLIRRKLNDNTRVGDIKKIHFNTGLSDVEIKPAKEKSDPNVKAVHQNWISAGSKLSPPDIIDAPPAYTPFPDPSDKTKY